MRRVEAAALAVLFAIVPLYGTLAVLDPSRPPIPPLIPAAPAALVGIGAVAALAALVPAVVASARRDALTAAFLAPGIASLLAALPGFDPVPGSALSLLVVGFGGAGLVLARRADAATVRLCLQTFLWSALLAALLALALVAAHLPPALYAYDNGRAVGTFLNPNELAAFALIGLGVAVPLAFASRGRDRLAVACAAVLLVTLAATFSRWGALSAVCGVAVYAAAARARVLLAAALVMAIAGVGVNALAGARHHNPRDAESRIVAWRTGLTTFERFPLLGVGPLAFSRTYDVFRPPDAPAPTTPVAFDPHSLPIAFAADGGIVAVVTLAFSFVVVLRAVFTRAARAATRGRALGFGLGAALAALLIHSGINTISILFPLGLQVVPIALGAARTDALD